MMGSDRYCGEGIPVWQSDEDAGVKRTRRAVITVRPEDSFPIRKAELVFLISLVAPSHLSLWNSPRKGRAFSAQASTALNEELADL
jgi:hypothetical protein